MDAALAFVLGFLGSLHCAAMCGPLMLAVPLLPGGAGRVWTGRIIYQAGRVATYILLGLVVGVVGKSLFLAGLQRWLSLALGAALLFGLLAAKKISFASPIQRAVGQLKNLMSGQLQKRGVAPLALLGMLNGLLPCGLVYVALAGALSQGSLSGSVIYMATFGLGTLPMLLAIAGSGQLFPVSLRTRLRGLIPLGVGLVAGLLILRGLALGIPYLSPDLTAAHPGCCAH